MIPMKRLSIALCAAAVAVQPITASAQTYPAAPPPDDHVYGDGQLPAPPPGYDGSQPPPPPAGYRDDAGYARDPALDGHYASYAEDWAQRYCVKSHGNTAAGAVIGGVLGAVLGSSLSGWRDRGTGALVGGVAGAAGGAAIGSQSGGTSPGCPPGYVVRGGAPAFYFDAGPTPYYYAAPGWYRPWFFYGGRWTYRPYPYHVWYYRNYGFGHPYGWGRRYGGGRAWHARYRRF